MGIAFSSCYDSDAKYQDLDKYKDIAKKHIEHFNNLIDKSERAIKNTEYDIYNYKIKCIHLIKKSGKDDISVKRQLRIIGEKKKVRNKYYINIMMYDKGISLIQQRWEDVVLVGHMSKYSNFMKKAFPSDLQKEIQNIEDNFIDINSINEFVNERITEMNQNIESSNKDYSEEDIEKELEELMISDNISNDIMDHQKEEKYEIISHQKQPNLDELNIINNTMERRKILSS